MKLLFEGYDSYQVAGEVIRAFEKLKEKEHEPVPVWGIIHLKQRYEHEDNFSDVKCWYDIDMNTGQIEFEYDFNEGENVVEIISIYTDDEVVECAEGKMKIDMAWRLSKLGDILIHEKFSDFHYLTEV